MFLRLLITFVCVLVGGAVGFEALDYFHQRLQLRRRERFYAGGRRG